MKKAPTKTSVTKIFDPKKVTLITDASEHALIGIIWLEGQSRKLMGTETKYANINEEELAVVRSTEGCKTSY